MIQINALSEKHLEEASQLVAIRYKALQAGLPVLPSQEKMLEDLPSELKELLSEVGGAVALSNNRVLGFITGLVIPEFLGRRSFYSPDWANGAVLGESRRIYEALYTGLSGQLVDNGCLLHAVSVFSHDQLGNDAWKWLGFGLSAVDGIREVSLIDDNQGDLKIKQATLEEIQEVTSFDRALGQHLADAPTFWIHEYHDYSEWMKETGNIAWLAYLENEVVGFIAFEPGNSCECMFLRDEKTINITGAFTLEQFRNKGISTAILNHVMEWAKQAGYLRCAVDFEAMNVLASRFWLKYFEPVSYSWIRWIDESLRR